MRQFFRSVTDDVMSPTVSITCRPGPVRLRPIKRERDSTSNERGKRTTNGSAEQQPHNGAVGSSSAGIDFLETSTNCSGAEKRQRLESDGLPRDSTDLFCATIAGMLRELQPFQRERIKRDIYNLVSDAILVEMAS